MKSVFEKILLGEIPGEIIYEDDIVFALIDINPKSTGHTLIIPKKLKENMFLENDDVLIAIINASKKVKQAYEKILGAKGFKFNTNINKEADQVVFHTHFHLIPYYTEKQNDPLTRNQIDSLKDFLK